MHNPDELTPAEKEELIQWILSRDEDADTPFMEDHAGSLVSRNQIADEIRRGTDFGREQLRVLLIERHMERVPPDRFVEEFVRIVEETNGMN